MLSGIGGSGFRSPRPTHPTRKPTAAVGAACAYACVDSGPVSLYGTVGQGVMWKADSGKRGIQTPLRGPRFPRALFLFPPLLSGGTFFLSNFHELDLLLLGPGALQTSTYWTGIIADVPFVSIPYALLIPIRPLWYVVPCRRARRGGAE